MTRILLFGGGGQLGQEIVARAPAFNVNLVAYSRTQADIADPAAVAAAIGEVKPHLVFNTAAYTRVDDAEREPHQAYRVNAHGPEILAQACALAGIPLLHFSTDYVFDGKKASAYVETDGTGPLNVYGASKLAGEEIIRANHQQHIILRTSWLYGRYGANFLKTMLRLAAERSEIKVVADQRGSPTSTSDVASAVLQLTPILLDGAAWGTYHFSGDGETNWYEFADEIFKATEKWTGSRPLLTSITSAEYPAAARRPSNSALDGSLFSTTYGFKPKPWQEAVSETVNALMNCGQS